MNIIVDAFGGDNAPLEVIKGCRNAVLDAFRRTGKAFHILEAECSGTAD